MNITGSDGSRADGEMLALLHAAADREASDVHLVAGHPVTYRVHGRLEPVGSALGTDELRGMVESIVPERIRGRLGEGKNFDFSVSLEHEGKPCRFRANVYLAQAQWCASLRHVPNDIPSFEWMDFPKALAQRLISHTNGLVIITGVTGSGKSTTLAALINLLNEQGGYRPAAGPGRLADRRDSGSGYGPDGAQRRGDRASDSDHPAHQGRQRRGDALRRPLPA
jgi:Tfp pilus assembly pilus retraction ATPase PilT